MKTIAVVLGLLCVIVAIVYVVVPAGSLPTFLPGMRPRLTSFSTSRRSRPSRSASSSIEIHACDMRWAFLEPLYRVPLLRCYGSAV